jgi:hypothetical protein
LLKARIAGEPVYIEITHEEWGLTSLRITSVVLLRLPRLAGLVSRLGTTEHFDFKRWKLRRRGAALSEFGNTHAIEGWLNSHGFSGILNSKKRLFGFSREGSACGCTGE